MQACGARNLWTRPLGGVERRQITFDEETIAYPAWSPDGHRILFERNQVRAAIWMAELP